MQPYLFPYIGYFQLVAAVDKFVFYDDVNFIKNGWINRNRLLISGDVRYLTIPLSGASPFLKINQIQIMANGAWRKKMSAAVRQSYAKAPHFDVIYNLFSEIVFSDELSISELAKQSVIAISKYLGLPTQFIMSSSIYGNSNLNGESRVLDICRREIACQYYNLPGGKELYQEDLFKLNGIELQFIDPRLTAYRQLSEQFYPGLSMIDVLMHNDRDTVCAMVRKQA